MRQVLARHAEQVRRAEVPGRDAHGARRRAPPLALHRLGVHDPAARAPLQPRQALVLVHVEPEVAHDGAIVGEPLTPCRLVLGDEERHPAQGELLRRGEELHVVRVLRDRARHGAAVEHARASPFPEPSLTRGLVYAP